MKYKQIVILILGLVFPFVAFSQTNVSLDPEFGARVALSVDKKIVKGLHVSLEEEARFDNNFGSFDRLQTTVGISYKLLDNIKLGFGYALINGYGSNSQAFKNPRHRFMADVTGTIHFDNWNFSLKERFQLTQRTDDYNPYQNPKNALALKSRLTVKYKGLGKKVTPYAYFEVRNYLNTPVIEAAFDGIGYYTLDNYSETGEPGWFLKGFNGGYVNRLRGALGMEVKIDKHNALDFYLLGDYVSDKEVDANAEGTKLKSYTKETGFKGWVGAEYKFSF